MGDPWREMMERDARENRLQAGWVIELGDGKEYVVDYVNESRAYCIPLGRREVEVATDEVDEETGETIKKKFTARERGINIAPTAMVKILRKEEPMAKRLCVVCGKGLHSDNKGDAHRACRKTPEYAVEKEEQAIIEEATASEATEAPADVEPAPAPGGPTESNNVNAAEAAPKKEKPVAKKTTKPAAKKAAPTGEGRKVTSYTTAAKQPKDDEFRAGSQIALVYEAVSSIGTATAAEVTARVAKKATTKGNLANNVAFYLSKLKGAGFLKEAR